METRTLQSGDLSDGEEDILWNYTVTTEGQWDIRLKIDSTYSIDERDEGNNEHYLIVTGVSNQMVGVVPSFGPPLFALLLIGFALAYLNSRGSKPSA